MESRRILSIDAAKGLAITLVVFGHVLGGTLYRHLLTPEAAWRGLYDFIYLFHMPVFFAISGFLLADSARTHPADALVSRIGSILWPYLLWDVIIRWALIPFIAPYMGSAPAQAALPQLLHSALVGELSWFFWTLFLVQALYIALSFLSPAVILNGSIAAYIGLANAPIGTLHAVVDYTPFLAVGAVARKSAPELNLGPRSPGIAIAMLIYALLALAVTFDLTSIRPIKLVCSFAGIFATMLLVSGLSPAIQSGFIARLGTASLAIYVLHPYFQGAARAAAQAAGVSNPIVHVTLQTLVAIGGSYALLALIERLNGSWLFRLPMPSLRRAQST